MTEYGRQQQRSLIQQREQMMNDIRRESESLIKDFEKNHKETTNVIKNEIIQYLTNNLSTL